MVRVGDHPGKLEALAWCDGPADVEGSLWACGLCSEAVFVWVCMAVLLLSSSLQSYPVEVDTLAMDSMTCVWVPGMDAAVDQVEDRCQEGGACSSHVNSSPAAGGHAMLEYAGRVLW